MKISLNSNQPERKLVAVLGEMAQGIFFRKTEDRSSTVFVSVTGEVNSENSQSLEVLLNQSSRRTGIYEGDTVTLQF